MKATDSHLDMPSYPRLTHLKWGYKLPVKWRRSHNPRAQIQARLSSAAVAMATLVRGLVVSRPLTHSQSQTHWDTNSFTHTLTLWCDGSIWRSESFRTLQAPGLSSYQTHFQRPMETLKLHILLFLSFRETLMHNWSRNKMIPKLKLMVPEVNLADQHRKHHFAHCLSSTTRQRNCFY